MIFFCSSSREVVVQRVAVQHRVEIIDADIAVETITGIRALALMPVRGIAPPRSNVSNGPWPCTYPRASSRAACHFLKPAQACDKIGAVLRNLGSFVTAY